MEDTPTKQTIERAHERSPMLIGSALVFGHGVKHLFNAGIFVVLPELQIHFGLSNSAIGALSTVRNVGGGLANIPAGYLSDRFSNQWATILALSLATVGIFHLLMGSVNAYWLLVLTATIANVGVTFWHPPAIAALSQMFARRRGLAIAMHGTGGSIGEALGPIAVGALLGVVLWRTVLQASAAPALATGALAWLALRGFRAESPSPTSFRAYLTAVLRLLRSPVLVNILVITGGFVSVQAIVMTFLPIYLRVDLGYSALTMSAFPIGRKRGGGGFSTRHGLPVGQVLAQGGDPAEYSTAGCGRSCRPHCGIGHSSSARGVSDGRLYVSADVDISGGRPGCGRGRCPGDHRVAGVRRRYRILRRDTGRSRGFGRCVWYRGRVPPCWRNRPGHRGVHRGPKPIPVRGLYPR